MSSLLLYLVLMSSVLLNFVLSCPLSYFLLSYIVLRPTFFRHTLLCPTLFNPTVLCPTFFSSYCPNLSYFFRPTVLICPCPTLFHPSKDRSVLSLTFFVLLYFSKCQSRKLASIYCLNHELSSDPSNLIITIFLVLI